MSRYSYLLNNHVYSTTITTAILRVDGLFAPSRWDDKAEAFRVQQRNNEEGERVYS